MTQPLHVPIERLDRAVFAAAADSSGRAFLGVQATYGTFYRMYVEDILHAAPVDDPRLPMALTRFALDPDWSSAQREVEKVLGDLAPQQQEFDDAFSRLHTLFPGRVVPRIVAFNSGYNFGIFPTDSVLGIGLEWFIGPDQRVVQLLSPEDFPKYVKDRMLPAMLVPSAVKGWLLTHYTRDIRGADLLMNLVETGKVMALLEVLLPGTDPAARFAFSQPQLKWCEDSEFNTWRELVSNELLYSKKEEDISRLMNDGPFTAGFPRESPGHIGEWIGYRMVRSYLDAHPEITFAQLFAMDDPRPILKSYKP
ncbi:MAG TPA: hypothetical protein VHL57_10600 [Flavobacteriales bacterium]|nr:hypothetical protein [Flavobacteriales bacterium]